MATRIGSYTLRLDKAPSIAGFASVASKKESEGPMAANIDQLCEDYTFGETSWKRAAFLPRKYSTFLPEIC